MDVGTRSSRVALALPLLCALLVTTPAGASGGNEPPPRATLTRLADAVRHATNAPGAIVAVQVGKRPARIVARGTQRRAGTPLRADDPFLTASVSKAFTAATVLALVDDGTLKLSDPVVKYVPGWDPRITIRMLLDHSTGLRSWGNKDDPDSLNVDLTLADLARRFAPAESIEPVRTAPLLAPPGRKTHYSNANTILAGEVVTAATGLPIGVAIDRYVVDPLHLDSTGYAPEGGEPRPAISGVLYVDDAKTVEIETAQYPMTSMLTILGPSIGMVSDAPDLLAFARAFLVGRFPDARLARDAKKIGRGGAGLGIIGFTPKGYCIFDGCPKAARFPRRGFAGNVDGGAVRVVYDPRLDTTVLVFANSSQRGKLDPFVLRTFRALRADG
jgi:D-alanyl-D-alanine carboxypeptidase